MDYEYYMDLALELAKTGVKACEQPYGAVLIANGNIVAKAYNKVRSSKNSLNHADIIVLDEYKRLNMNDVKDLTLVTTCEPCENCFNTAINIGVNKFVFGSSIEESIKYNTGDKLLKIKQFEEDIKAGKEIKVENYVVDIKKDYGNNVSSFGLFTSKTFAEGFKWTMNKVFSGIDKVVNE